MRTIDFVNIYYIYIYAYCVYIYIYKYVVVPHTMYIPKPIWPKLVDRNDGSDDDYNTALLSILAYYK